MKKFFRGLLLVCASATFAGLLFFTATLFTFWTVLSKPNVIKQSLARSGVYASVIDEITKQTKVEQTGETKATVLESKQIASLAKTSFTPEVIQTDAEQVIDGVYGWLQGITPNPEFNIDLSTQKNALVAGIAGTLTDKLRALPDCTGSKNSITEADLTSLDCLPKNLDINNTQANFIDEFNKTSNFLPDNKLTGNLLKINKNGKAMLLGDALPWVPKVYRALVWAPWVSLGLLGLSTVGLILLSTNKRKGSSRVARGFLFSGALLVIVGVTLVPATEKLNLFAGSYTSNSLTENIINPLLAQVWKHTARINLIIGGGYVIVSLLIYVTLLLTRVKNIDAREPQSHADPSPASSVLTQSNPPSPQRSAPQKYQQAALTAPLQASYATSGTTPTYQRRPIITQQRPKAQTVRGGSYKPPAMPQPSVEPLNDSIKRPPMVQG